MIKISQKLWGIYTHKSKYFAFCLSSFNQQINKEILNLKNLIKKTTYSKLYKYL